ncbi:CoB--CoM heterodisulfide reductase subunit C [Methanobacterium aggregans]|uniref:CoB--CoM heterodisulfide reductase subunit C n=1 Tax=Methanobacterium aggregans TaxID=1615586 RepID=UPI001AE11C08|nr:CoB--CoM heterodisulfide reductase subunit C [Methanobacterium aggregans]MBP2044814.1 heterodisulfide reductase subunit C [Methanobacterium aggregans]
MSFLNRLKNMLTGDENPEKESAENSVEQSESEVKTEKPTEEKQETVKESVSKTNETKSKEAIKKDVEPVEEKIETDTEISKEAVKTEKSDDESEKVSVREEKSEKPKTERSGIMTLLEGREKATITREDIDVNFKQEIMDAGAESVAVCFQCGTCSGACPSGRRTPYKVRQLVRKAVMGLKEDVISDDTIWMCTTCYECQERCPRGIKIVDVVKAVRNQAAHAGYMAPAHKATGSFVIKTGHGVPINDATKALRKSVGLTELPPTTHEFPEALEEVQKITKLTGFDSLIGYNWETGELE